MSSMVTSERAAEYQGIVQSVTTWADEQHDIAGVATVGSWARHEPEMDSDLDLVVLTVDKQRYRTTTSWVPEAVGRQVKIVRTQSWGPLTEHRVVLQSGFQIEFGFVAPSWASTDPLDEGTARVVRDGCLPLYDPSGVFEQLTEAVHAT
jgi:predicted nucleotidyltransferase